jgi:hypothetical protein
VRAAGAEARGVSAVLDDAGDAEAILGSYDRHADGFYWDDELARLPPRESLIDGILDVNTDAELFGEWGAGKTFLAIHMTGCLVTGHHFAGRAVQQAQVVYVCAEGFAGMRSRWQGWATHYGVTDRAGVLFYNRPVNLLKPDAVRAFVEQVQSMAPTDGYVLFIFDTKTRCTAGGDERAGADSAIMLASLASIRAAYDGRASTLILHHPGRTEKERPRGHSSEDGALDTLILVRKPDNGLNTQLEVRLTKQKDGDDSIKLAFTLAAIGLDDGTTTGVIVDSDMPVPDPVEVQKQRIVRGARQALKALAAQPGPTGWAAWRRACQPIADTTFERALKVLTTGKYVEQADDSLYTITELGREKVLEKPVSP